MANGPQPFGNAGQGPQPFGFFGGGLPFVPNPPVPATRYFRRNEGTTDYATIPEVTLAGDFEIEFDLLTTASGTILGDSHLSAYWLNISLTGFGFWFAGSNVNFLHGGLPLDGSLHRIRLVLNGTTAEMFVDGASIGTQVVVPYTGPNNFRLYSSNTITSNNLSGILANLKIYDAGTLVRDYPIDDNSDTLVDMASGQDGTVINGNASDWGLYAQQATGEWLGQELVVNGDFSQGATGWTLGAGWSIGGGIANSVMSPQFSGVDQDLPTIIGVVVRVSYGVISYSQGTVDLRLPLNIPPITGIGPQTHQGIALSNNVVIRSGSNVPLTGSIDNVSIKEVLNVA